MRAGTHLVAPDGTTIKGTLERLQATALVREWVQNEDGTLDILEWDGETEVFWDGQETVEKEGQIQVVDEEGHEWAINACTLTEPVEPVED